MEVPSAEYGLVEDVSLHQELALAGPHVLAEVQLADSARDLTDFPAVQTGPDQLGAVLLLEFPEARVGLEDLLEQVALAAAVAVGGSVANPSELAVRALHQGSEGL